MTPVTLPLAADKRTPFEKDIAIVGPDWSGATFLMHVRAQPGDTGSPLLSLANASAGSQGISAVYEADYTHVYDGQTLELPATILTLFIAEASLEALSLNNPTNQPLNLAYDLHITPSGGVKFVALQGAFTINPGVTI
jgi:hypothetical protein